PPSPRLAAGAGSAPGAASDPCVLAAGPDRSSASVDSRPIGRASMRPWSCVVDSAYARDSLLRLAPPSKPGAVEVRIANVVNAAPGANTATARRAQSACD